MNLGKMLKPKCSVHAQYSLRLGSPSAGARLGHVAGAGKVTAHGNPLYQGHIFKILKYCWQSHLGEAEL